MLGLRIAHLVTLLHQLGPHAPASTELGDLVEEVHVDVEEKGQPLGELLHVAAAPAQLIDVGQTVGQCVGHFLRCGGAGVAHVGASDADGVEARGDIVGVKNRVRDQAHRRADREDPRSARHIFLQDVVLNRARQLVARHALFVGNGQVHRIDDRGRAVDGEGGGNAREVQALKQNFRLAQIGERNADLADFRPRHGMRRIKAALGWQIERHGQASLPLGEQKLVALVGFFRRAEA